MVAEGSSDDNTNLTTFGDDGKSRTSIGNGTLVHDFELC